VSTGHLLTIAEAAQRVNLKPAALRRAIHRNELAAIKLCSRIRIDPVELDQWISRHQITSNDNAVTRA
jgi:excisionase family DNA binding protein